MPTKTLTLTETQVVKAIGIPYDYWAGQCHAISIAIVKSDLIAGPRRVARGFASGVRSQHSWVVVGDDCYDRKAQIIDPTLWSYDSTVDGIWTGTLKDGRHHPHGEGSIWKFGRPPEPVGPVIELQGYDDLSRSAKDFLGLCGPLDMEGWKFLAHAPVEGWPAKEIFTAMDAMPMLCSWVPIDILGMVTDLNPKSLYLPSALGEEISK